MAAVTSDKPYKALTLDKCNNPALIPRLPRSLKYDRIGRLWYLLRREESTTVDLYCDNKVFISADMFEEILSQELSDAQKMKRETMRSFGTGITSFLLDEGLNGTHDCLIPLDQQRFCRFNYMELKEGNIDPTILEVKNMGMNIDNIKLDKGRVFFTTEMGNFASLIDGKIQEWTSDATDTLKYGVAEFAAQEELDRYDGYWPAYGNDYVAVTSVDESMIEEFSRVEYNKKGESQIVKMRYPFAGGPVARVSLNLLNTSTPEWTHLNDLERIWKREEFYIVGVKWQDDCLVTVTCSRDQRKYNLMAFDTVLARIIGDVTYTDEHWVNAPRINHYLYIPLPENTCGHFLVKFNEALTITSLNRRTKEVKLFNDALTTSLNQGTMEMEMELFCSSFDVHCLSTCLSIEGLQLDTVMLHPEDGRIVFCCLEEAKKKLQQVLVSMNGAPYSDSIYLTHSSRESKLVYIQARDSIYSSIYSARLRLTDSLDKCHFQLVHWNGDKLIVQVESVKMPPKLFLIEIVDFTRSSCKIVVTEFFNSAVKEHLYHLNGWIEPIYGVISGYEGHNLNYKYYLPRKFDNTKKYPVICFVYGGPHVNLVNGKFITSSTDLLMRYMLDTYNVIVFQLDNRGSSGRGHAFETPIKGCMGTLEVIDMYNGVDFLRSLPFVDKGNIGIHGHSYGGYLSLMCLFQNPEYFKAAVAGAPVVDWELYDNTYTERYMGLPSENKEGYKAGHVCTYAHNYNDEKQALYVYHGMADDNVLLAHTNQLVMKLNELGKTYQQLYFPGEKHSMNVFKCTRIKLNKSIVSFFQEKLGLEAIG